MIFLNWHCRLIARLKSKLYSDIVDLNFVVKNLVVKNTELAMLTLRSLSKHILHLLLYKI